MLKRKAVALGFVALLLGLMTSACYAGDPTPKDVQVKFSKIFSKTQVSSVEKSVIPGLYQVEAGPNVFYYAPAGEGHLIFGQIVDKNGKNLTASVMMELRAKFEKEMAAKSALVLKTLPLNQAIKIGHGPNTVIEFTDPDCPFCRRVDQFLETRTDVTRYIFLNPLDQLHPTSRAKSAWILHSSNPGKALLEVFNGKHDNDAAVNSMDNLTKYPAAAKQIAENLSWGQKVGLQGTPLLFVNGVMVNGANIPAITQNLKK